MEHQELLQIRNLVTSFRIKGEYYAAVDGVSLSVRENEVFAIVGESGCGKTALAMSILKLHNEHYTRVEGEVFFKDQDLLSLREAELNKVRGGGIGMIFQDPLTALNPLMRIGAQIEESLSYHLDLDSDRRRLRALELLRAVGIERPELCYQQYPYELSGGMRQRAMIATALACKPSLVIADEPTTALDVTIQAQILDLLKDLQREMKSGIILITHDLGVVAEMADRVAVMYAGQVVESAPVRDLFKNPRHPYTRSLLASVPQSGSDRLHVISGMVPSLDQYERKGCRFADRIPWIDALAHEDTPTYHEVGPEHIVLCTCHEHFHFNEEGGGMDGAH